VTGKGSPWSSQLTKSRSVEVRYGANQEQPVFQPLTTKTLELTTKHGVDPSPRSWATASHISIRIESEDACGKSEIMEFNDKRSVGGAGKLRGDGACFLSGFEPRCTEVLESV
jgi:hypothetical protein